MNYIHVDKNFFSRKEIFFYAVKKIVFTCKGKYFGRDE